MREVIQKVLEAEREGGQIVERARAEAELIVSHARKEAEERLAQAHSETRAKAELAVEAATQAAGQLKQERLARAAVEIENELQLDEATRHCAVEAALRCVCGFHRPTAEEDVG